jgi:predicted phage terminase large subunit-like protein
MLPTLTTDDLTNAERELCRRSLAAFVRRAWRQIEPGQPYVHGWHVDAICEHLEAITNGDITRLLINIPPGTMKSTLCSVFWPAWEWGPKGMPSTRIINAAHEQGLAIRDTLKMRRLIQSEWYQRLWPTGLTSDQNQKTYYENSATGFRQACAVASMTGRRGDRVIWDDPHSIESAHSDTGRDTAIRVFTETLPTRLSNPDRSAIVVVMQRIHEADVSGYILANDLGYDHLCLPMEYEPSSRVTSIGFRDPRTEPGELLFPGRFSRETVDRDKKIMGSFAVAGQFQQRPSPLGGGLFRDSWWQYYQAEPSFKWRAIYADTAQKTKESSDYSVFQCWGVTAENKAYLVDMIRGKWEAPELLQQARAFWSKHKAGTNGTLRSMNIEDKVSGTGLIQTIKREGVPVIAIQRSTDKVTRAMDVAPSIEAGHVFLPMGREWLSDFLREHSQFPSSAHDDCVDPAIDAVYDMLVKTQYEAPTLIVGY